MKLAYLGLGRAALHHHLPHVRDIPGVDVVGGADPSPQARSAGLKAGIPMVEADAAELLRRVEPDIVSVTTPPDSHAALAILSLEHGAHVYCEKPFVASLAEADQVIAAASRVRRSVAINNQYRRMEIYRSARELVGTPEFGDLLFVQARGMGYRTPATENGWRAQLRRRTLFEFGTHVLDLVRYLYGADPVRIHAVMPRVLPQFDADLLDLLTIEFPRERFASILINRIHHGADRYLDITLDGERASMELALDHKRQRGDAWLVRSAGGERKLLATDETAPWGVATGRHFRHFIEDLVAGREPETSAKDNRVVLKMCLAAYESAESGMPVDLERSA